MDTITSNMTRNEVVEKMRAKTEERIPQFDFMTTGAALGHIGIPTATGPAIARMMKDWNTIVDANWNGTTTKKFSEYLITTAENATNVTTLRSVVTLAEDES